MRAPESEDELTSKTVSKDAGRQYTSEEWEYALSRTELFRQLERDPVLSFIKPNLIALFAVLRESGFVLGAFEMEKVYDWDHESWTNAIHTILDPLAILVGTVKLDENANCTRDDAVRSALREPDARVSSRYDGHSQESTDVAMESVSSRSSSHSKRDQDEDPDDLFDLDAGLTGTAAAVSTATAGAGVARVRLSAFSELKEFNGKDASKEKARAWFNRLKSASRRDGMSGDEVCALFGDLMAGPARQWYLQ
ncbi:Eukaryotic/viral aspartic protease, partial [Phytophthora megakarya]